MEYLGDRQWMVQGRRTRFVSLLGTLFLLLGLILKVQAQAPVVEKNPSIHAFHPVMVEETFPFAGLHPPAKPALVVYPPQVHNPTAQTDLEGQTCRKCHSSSLRPLAQAVDRSNQASLALESHRGLGAYYACESCHMTQLSLNNRGALLH